MSAHDSVRDELAELARLGLLREPRVRAAHDGVRFDLSSNDYLGFGAEPLRMELERSGAGASMLVSGNWDVHEKLAAELASWLGLETSMLFPAGFAANLGAVSGLVRPGDLVLSDRLNHASIIDGCRLSGADVVVYPHLDVGFVAEHLKLHRRRYRRCLVVTESYFSMDADSPDLPGLRDVAKDADALLMVDEAHAVGVLGPEGRGLCSAAGVTPDLLVGTLGKAFGLQGAFVCATHEIRALLWNRARSFVFSTGLAPVLARGALERLVLVRSASERRRSVLSMSEELRRRFSQLGSVVGFGPIVPVVLGDGARALEVQRRLILAGVLVGAIRPPTVPVGTSRLRVVGGFVPEPQRAALLANVDDVLASLV